MMFAVIESSSHSDSALGGSVAAVGPHSGFYRPLPCRPEVSHAYVSELCEVGEKNLLHPNQGFWVGP